MFVVEKAGSEPRSLPIQLFWVLMGAVFSLFSSPACAQSYNQGRGYLNANSQWIFGSNLSLDKRSNTVAIRSGFNATGATLSVADSVSGNLLFYANGYYVWTAAGQIMPNGYNIGGDISGARTQPICAVPFIDDPDKYYIFAQSDPFSSSGYSPNGKGKLFYSVLDMKLNNGAGDIVAGQKGILLDSLLSSSIIAVPGNHCDVWLVAHGLYESVFKAFHITAAGVDNIPVVSVAGPAVYQPGIPLGGNIWRQGYVQGQMSISPDRSRIAIGVVNLNGIPFPVGVKPLGFVLARFNADNGQVTEAIQVNDGDIQVYGTGFSPNSQKLYVNVLDNSGVTPGIVQYDISTHTHAAITASANVVFALTSWGPKQKYMKLYNDTLYLSDQSLGMFPTLSRINHPDLSGGACGYEAGMIPLLQPGEVVQGLPNDVVFPLPPDTSAQLLLDTLVCGALTPFVLTATPGKERYLWNTGSVAPQVIANRRDIFWAISFKECNVYVDTFKIRGANVTLDLGPDKTLCNQAVFTLTPRVASDHPYHLTWQDGSSSENYTGSASGAYWLRAESEDCIYSDTIQVKNIDLAQNLGPDDIACKHIPVELLLSARGPDEMAVLWSDGSRSRDMAVSVPGTYWVKVQVGQCEMGDTINVIRNLCDCSLGIPNAFSPNNDGLNDLFLPVIETACPINNYTLQVYNRWGQLLYSSFEAGLGWDGRFNGLPCETGTYFYTLRMTKGTEKLPFYQKGELMLIR